jgi:hypothetical protein
MMMMMMMMMMIMMLLLLMMMMMMVMVMVMVMMMMMMMMMIMMLTMMPTTRMMMILTMTMVPMMQVPPRVAASNLPTTTTTASLLSITPELWRQALSLPASLGASEAGRPIVAAGTTTATAKPLTALDLYIEASRGISTPRWSSVPEMGSQAKSQPASASASEAGLSSVAAGTPIPTTPVTPPSTNGQSAAPSVASMVTSSPVRCPATPIHHQDYDHDHHYHDRGQLYHHPQRRHYPLLPAPSPSSSSGPPPPPPRQGNLLTHRSVLHRWIRAWAPRGPRVTSSLRCMTPTAALTATTSSRPASSRLRPETTRIRVSANHSPRRRVRLLRS